MFIFEIAVIWHIKQFKKLKDTNIIDKINKISGKQVKSIDEAKITLFQMILKKNRSGFYHELKLFDEFIKLNNNYKIIEFPNWDHVKKFLYDSNATNRIVTLIVFVFAIINTIFIKCNDFEIIFNAFEFVFSIQFIYYIMITLPVLIGFYFAAGSLFNAFFNSFEFFMSKKIENKKVNDLFLRRFLSDLAKYALIK